MRSVQYIVLAFLLSAVMGHAQSLPTQSRRSVQSRVDFFITNTGVFGRNHLTGGSGHIAPRDSGTSYIDGGGIWFGARKRVDGELRPLTFITYDSRTTGGWGSPGGIGEESSADLCYSGDYFRSTGTPTSPLVASRNWPLWLRPGNSTTQLDPGEFVGDSAARAVGDVYPQPAFIPMVGDQFFSRFNDNDTSKYGDASAPGMPIGLEFDQHVWDWSRKLCENAVLLRYDIVNRSGDTLYDCVVGAMLDVELGTNSPDSGVYDERSPELRSLTVWSGPETSTYGTLVATIVEGPVVGVDGFVDHRRRFSYRDDGRAGSARVWSGDLPGTHEERYDWMSTDTHDVDPQSARHLLLTTTPFSMRPGDTAHFAVAYTVVPNVRRPEMATMRAVELVPVSIIGDYFGFLLPSSVESPVRDEWALHVVPNPATDMLVVRFDAHERSTLRLVDALGRSRFERALDAGEQEAAIDLAGLSAGVYLVSIEVEGVRVASLRVVVR